MLITFICNRSHTDYERLLVVWDRSAARYMPTIPRRVVRIEPPTKDHGRLADITHTFLEKTKWLLEHPADYIVTDVDLMFRGNMAEAFDKPFDVAVTKRDAKRPYSSGVWFYRNTDKAHRFLRLWRSETKRIQEKIIDSTMEKAMLKKHGGLDQASLAAAIEKNTFAEVMKLPCAMYNAERSCWENMHPECKAVHIYTELRALCLTGDARKFNTDRKFLQPIAREFWEYT